MVPMIAGVILTISMWAAYWGAMTLLTWFDVAAEDRRPLAFLAAIAVLAAAGAHAWDERRNGK